MNSIKTLLILALIFFLTMLIVMTGCHNNCTHETVDWEDSDEWHGIWYNELDTNSDGDVDSLRIRTWEVEDPYPYELGE